MLKKETYDQISVVIPIYKVEQYLNECVESVVNQTYKNLEIILVDDGSPDNCPKICDEWAKKDGRIKVIHKKNGGVSDARNAGIKVATGKYISFVDSDDYIENNLYEIAINKLKDNNAQLFIFGRTYLYGQKKEIKYSKEIELIMDTEEALDKMNMFQYYDVAVWDKIYERNLFDGIEFPKGKLCEDWYTIYKVIDRVTKVVYNSKPFYVYRQRENSITHSNNIKINREPIYASKEVLDYIKEKHPSIVSNALAKYVISCIGVYNNYLYYTSDTRIEKEEILKIVKDNYKEVIKNKDLSFHRRAQLFLVCKCNLLYNILIKSIRKTRDKKIRLRRYVNA